MQNHSIHNDTVLSLIVTAKVVGHDVIEPAAGYSGVYGLSVIDGVGRIINEWDPINKNEDAFTLAVRSGAGITDRDGRLLGEDDPEFSTNPDRAVRLALVRHVTEMAGHLVKR